MGSAPCKANAQSDDRFVAVDLETTGLKPDKDQIIEIAAIWVENGAKTETQCDCSLPDTIVKLIGITERQLRENGLPPQKAVKKLVQFIGKERLIGVHLDFDMQFFQTVCKRCEIPFAANRCTDLLDIARRRVYGCSQLQADDFGKVF